MHRVILFALPWLLALTAPALFADPEVPGIDAEIVPEDWLVACDMPAAGGREPLGDAVALDLILGTFVSPADGAELRTFQAADARSAWRRLSVPGGKWTQGVSGKFYATTTIELAEPRRALLVAEGVTRVWINATTCPGDVYTAGYALFPVALRAGKNHLTFLGMPRGGITVKLVPPRALVQLNLADVTAPDLIHGRAIDDLIGIPVLNTLPRTVVGAVLTIGDGTRFPPVELPLPPLAPNQVFKAAARVVRPEALTAADGESVDLPIAVRCGDSVDAGVIKLRLLPAEAPYKRTFRSRLDGSVQYCGVREAGAATPASRPALVLSLHGAAVEAIGQASAYARHADKVIIAPTNRRPFGFDWEDWGMLDALETLDLAAGWYPTDPDRVYLTGHSMGGHGTWVAGLLHANRFAAIAPSAGWASFALYGGGGSSVSFGSPALQDILARCKRHSDLLGFLDNARHTGVYLLHGKDDDNVPVSQARMMKYFLERHHADVRCHEEPGAGHWWDKQKEVAGADCVDWAPMWEFFATHTLSGRPAEFTFVTPSPAVASRARWLEILCEQSPNSDARVTVTRDAADGVWRIQTANVVALAIDRAAGPGADAVIELDGTRVDPPSEGAGVRVAIRNAGGWTVGAAGTWTGKRPGVHGPLKEAFFRPFVFVVGTQGTAEENAAARDVAVYLANLWWWRGNGSVRIVADDQVTPTDRAECNLILFGHRQSNALLAEAELPLAVSRGEIRMGTHVLRGPGLATAFVAPAPGQPERLWAVYGGSDAAGLRLAILGEILRSGAALPDFLVWDAEAVSLGFGAAKWAGYFGPAWSEAGGLATWGE